MKAEAKNYELLCSLEEKQKTFCNGCGIRKIKTRLTKLVKSGNPLAKALRLLLETETVNIKAKADDINYIPKSRFMHTVKEMLYYQKENLLTDIITICKENQYTYGYQKTDNYSAQYIVYFEIPGTQQISYHTNLDVTGIPLYEKEWDGLENSTLGKLEESIARNFPDIVK